MSIKLKQHNLKSIEELCHSIYWVMSKVMSKVMSSFLKFGLNKGKIVQKALDF